MMEELLGSSAGQGDVSVAKPAVSVGKTLRETRERLGLSIADVSNQTKIVARQIEALEADDFQHLPEMTFVRGFVRSYAKLLHLDAQPLLAALPQPATGPVKLKPASVEVPFPRAHSQRVQNMLWMGGALFVTVLVVVFAVWHYMVPPGQPEVAQVETPVVLPGVVQAVPASPVAEAGVMAASAPLAELPASSVGAEASLPVASAPAAVATTQPAPAPVAVPGKPAVAAQPPAPVAATKPAVQPAKSLAQFVQPQLPAAKPLAAPATAPQTTALRLVFDADSWTEVSDRSGKIISSQINPRGSELRLEGNAPFTLVIGRAASVRLYYKGKQVDLKPRTNAFSEVARVTVE